MTKPLRSPTGTAPPCGDGLIKHKIQILMTAGATAEARWHLAAGATPTGLIGTPKNSCRCSHTRDTGKRGWLDRRHLGELARCASALEMVDEAPRCLNAAAIAHPPAASPPDPTRPSSRSTGCERRPACAGPSARCERWLDRGRPGACAPGPIDIETSRNSRGSVTTFSGSRAVVLGSALDDLVRTPACHGLRTYQVLAEPVPMHALRFPAICRNIDMKEQVLDRIPIAPMYSAFC